MCYSYCIILLYHNRYVVNELEAKIILPSVSKVLGSWFISELFSKSIPLSH